MKLVLTLLARDEADVVAAMLEHHLAAGVEFVVATDNGSVDGTTDILATYQRAGVLELRHEPTHNFDQARWVTAMARRAAEVHGADWVINADADEFWWPRDGTSLAALLAAVPDQYGTVEAPRENLVGDPQAGAAWPQRLVVRDLLSLHERGGRIGPKSAHRGDPLVNVQMGNHGVTGPGIGPRWPASPITILHVPDRSYQQFARKIVNGGSSYAANSEFDSEVGWHWRADFARLQDGGLEPTWQARQLAAGALAAGLAATTLVPDVRLRDRLCALLDSAVVPSALQAVLLG